jgi:hypothetical protein
VAEASGEYRLEVRAIEKWRNIYEENGFYGRFHSFAVLFLGELKYGFGL